MLAKRLPTLTEGIHVFTHIFFAMDLCTPAMFRLLRSRKITPDLGCGKVIHIGKFLHNKVPRVEA